jgi:mRNA interferase MazF
MSPKRGEIWLVNLDPTIGAEIKKTRPAIVISSDVIGKLPLKLVVPLTDWKSAFVSNLWHVCIEISQDNGLAKTSAADVLQMRSVDPQRFIQKIGVLSEADLIEVALAIALIVEYQERDFKNQLL